MTEIADAVRADAAEARAEIRAAGIICPSCGKNWADLDHDIHWLVLCFTRGPGLAFAECCSGDRVPLIGSGSTFATVQAAANIAVLDNCWHEESTALRSAGYPV